MAIDERLVNRLLNRDQQALVEIYDRYHLLIWKIIRNAVADQAICEQLVSQVFKDLWTKPQEFNNGRKLIILLIECCRSKISQMPVK